MADRAQLQATMAAQPLTILLLTIFLFCAEALATGGEWRLLRNIGISAMHMQLLRNGKIVMFDRTDVGPSNLSLPSDRCRHDLQDTVSKTDCTAHSLFFDPFTNSVAPLTIQTDTWCSSGSVLPDGSLLQTGGYNDGERSIRSLPACFFSSEATTCDWSEQLNYLSVRRWYATNQILPDGNVIVIGGRRQFNYEFFPKRELIDLPFLRETRDPESENNLYPFVHLLPDGSLFVFANTKGIALDYKNSRILRTYPEIPGGEPRNYPSSGSSVLLPIDLTVGGNSTITAEVLICGGAPPGAYRQALNGTFVPALKTCGRLVLTDIRATWQMEEMPAARVMGDMLLLPTGEVIIINGAGKGSAGWELAKDPVTSPWIYHPKESAGKRFTVHRRSEIPRMYHSAAVVDIDGRVIVGGSNPHVYYNFTGVEFPTELRLEAFSPPYLDRGNVFRRPAGVEVTAALRYGEEFAVKFKLAEYVSDGSVMVALLAPSFTTHSLAMNQRMVVLQVEKVKRLEGGVGSSAYEIGSVAPPNANIAPPGYYLLFVVHAGIPSKGAWINVQ